MHIQVANALFIRTDIMLLSVFESMCDTVDVTGRGEEYFMVVTQTQFYLSSVLQSLCICYLKLQPELWVKREKPESPCSHISPCFLLLLAAQSFFTLVLYLFG